MTAPPHPTAVPDQSPALRRRNLAVIQRESAALGIVNASGVYIAVFLIRLGGTNLDVSLLTALPALGGFLLAIPAGAFLQSRRNVIPWYTATRAVQFMVFAAIAVVVALAPAGLAITIIVVIWAAATIPGTISAVASNVVLNGVAGPSGRYDLISRRYGIMGLTTAISVAVVGQILEAMGFPLNYQVVFVALSVAGLLACYYSFQLVIPDHGGADADRSGPLSERIRGYMGLLRSQPAFLRFVTRRFLLTFGIGLAAPLVPLWYIREANAPDAWIGIIGTSQSLAVLAGYYAWRRAARRQSTRLLVAVATLGIALYPAVLVLSRDLLVLAFITAYGAVMAAGLNLVLFDELMKTVPMRHIVAFSGVENSLGNLASITAPILGAVLADLVGIGPALLVAASLTLLGATLLVLAGPTRSE
jgi:hypothetical protein